MPIEFVGVALTNTSSEYHELNGPVFDKEFLLRLTRAHEDNGWDRLLCGYASGSPIGSQVAAWIVSHLDKIKILLAHRPNVSYPTYAARQFATLDQLSDGRLSIHFITGGSDHEQRREGDVLSHDERYVRTQEYIQIIKQVWSSRESFSHHGPHYQFDDFISTVFPVQDPWPRISFGGSSEAALAVGSAEADVYALWGEPLVGTASQIQSIRESALNAGRDVSNLPRVMLFVRPIIGPTEELAWERAHHLIDTIKSRQTQQQVTNGRRLPASGVPENEGTLRLLRFAAQGERFDRAGWMPQAVAPVSGAQAINLVGTPETVAEALLDYYDIGVSIFQVRAYDTLNDAIDFGRYVIPLVRQGAEERDRQQSPLVASVSSE